MKVGDFKKQLVSFSKVLEAGNSKTIAQEINHLATIFDGHESLMIAKFMKLATPSSNVQKAANGILLLDVLSPLRELEKFLTPCAKLAFLKDLHLLIDLLATSPNTTVSDFVPFIKSQLTSIPAQKKRQSTSLNKALVEEYLRRLKADYKDVDTFRIIFEELKRDRAIRKQEAAAISDEFAYATPPSTAKKTSLERIKSVHQHYHSSVLNEKAMGGRSAA